jgi:hypothetical protein
MANNPDKIPKIVQKKYTTMILVAAGLVFLTILMLSMTRDFSYLITGAVLCSGYIYFAYHHYKAAADGLSAFEGVCTDIGFNPLTFTWTYTLLGNTTVRLLSKSRLNIHKRSKYRLYLRKDAFSPDKEKMATIREYYGYEKVEE